MSLPSRERGLKFVTNSGVFWCIEVAPLAGAWIEINPFRKKWTDFLSLPSRERGLKFWKPPPPQAPYRSLPSRERGLKCIVLQNPAVRESSLPSRERGLKFRRCTGLFRSSASLPSRERGLKLYHDMPLEDQHGRSPRGSVD